VSRVAALQTDMVAIGGKRTLAQSQAYVAPLSNMTRTIKRLLSGRMEE